MILEDSRKIIKLLEKISDQLEEIISNTSIPIDMSNILIKTGNIMPKKTSKPDEE